MNEEEPSFRYMGYFLGLDDPLVEDKPFLPKRPGWISRVVKYLILGTVVFVIWAGLTGDPFLLPEMVEPTPDNLEIDDVVVLSTTRDPFNIIIGSQTNVVHSYSSSSRISGEKFTLKAILANRCDKYISLEDIEVESICYCGGSESRNTSTLQVDALDPSRRTHVHMAHQLENLTDGDEIDYSVRLYCNGELYDSYEGSFEYSQRRTNPTYSYSFSEGPFIITTTVTQLQPDESTNLSGIIFRSHEPAILNGSYDYRPDMNNTSYVFSDNESYWKRVPVWYSINGSDGM